MKIWTENNVTHREILDVMVAFSIAGEGTNVLFERIFELIYPNLMDGKYDRHDLELIISHFPQDFWRDSSLHSGKQKNFNETIAKLLLEEIENSSTRELLSFFQAFSLTPKFPKELLNRLLNRFATLIESNKLTSGEFMNFIELYALMIKNSNKDSNVEIDSSLIIQISSQYLNKNYSEGLMKFDLREVAELYWIYATWGIFSDSQNSESIKTLENILNGVISEYISKYRNLTESEKYDGIQQELDFEEKDADSIIFYYEKFGDSGALNNSKQVINTLKSLKKKYDDRPENERKWFVF